MTPSTGLTHRCPGPGCRRAVPVHMLACRSHWYQVSKVTRDWVWAAYAAEPGSPDHRAAMDAAIAEMHE